jgi:AcrR family transcriptional regulator
MDVKPNRRVEQGEATRAQLVATARGLFATRGYANVGTEEIVRAAGVTRGALYHHFSGKAALFRAVVEEVDRDLMARLAAEAAGATDPLDAMHRGAATFLDACLDEEIQRITLIDAPAVLGWAQWREIGAQYGVGLVEGVLSAAMEAGQIERQPVRPLAHVLIGALDEAALMVARADDVAAARAEVGEIVDRLVEGLRPRR